MVNHSNIIKFYQEGNSLAACEREFNISTYKLKKMFNSYNVHIRDRHEQCVIENMKRGYKVNHNYFHTLNDTSAYYLGFIAADGTIRKNRNAIKIGLQVADEQWLIEFKEKAQIEAPIKHYTVESKYPVAELEFSSKQIKEDLENYSIVPDKTYKNISMKNIPDVFKLSFIKGFYDGDGSYTAGKVKITSKTKGLFEEIQDFTDYPWYLYHTSRDLYSLELSTTPSLQFLKDIYNINTPKLERKYNKYLIALNSRI